MKTLFRRTLSLLLVLVMAVSLFPVAFAQEQSPEPVKDSVVLTDEDYASANAVFAQIDKLEDAPATRSASRTELVDRAAALVMASDSYVEGSLERNGNSFTWWTEEGIRCIYNPYMREKYANMQAPKNPEPSGIYNEPVPTKGGWPSGNQVYLIAPYYGIDDSFTDQYKNEAKSIATAIGDTDGYTLYSGTSVTVDTVAQAISNGAVVIFDSHGTTDYDGKYVCNDPDGYEVYDYVSNAKYSYLCLTNKSGLTTADYNAGATYFTDTDGYMCACINGATIANHMTKNSPSGLLWMAICLGMATNTMCQPMRNKGVEVVYGYSQSVTFAGDYCFEETFWDNMIAGKTVAQSISAMKSRWGKWDWSEEIASNYGYSGSGYTLTEARKYRSAFPIVVSDEDTHPGQRTSSDSSYGACSEQTVKSTYTLFSQYSVTAQSNNTAFGTVSVNGSTITAKPATGYFAQSATVTSGSATVSQSGNTFQVSANSDCVVQINFAAKTAVTVNFSGASVASQTGYAGDSMSLPSATAPEGFSFVGWMSAPMSEDSTEKPSFYTGSFTPNGNTTLYALYSYVDENTSSGTGDYVKVTENRDDWSGEYLIVYEAGSMAFNSKLTTLEATGNGKEVTITNNTISADEGDPCKFVITSMSGGYSIQAANGKYISGTASSNKLNESTSPVVNTISIDASGNADIVSNTSHLRYNTTSGQDRFRYFRSTTYSSQNPVALYVKDGAKGTTYYTTSPVKCEHAHTTNVAAVAATCTQTGFSAGVYCNDCETYISGHAVVAALGHSWGAWVETTAPTCTDAGVETATCSRCAEKKTQAVPATGHDYTQVVTPPTATEQGYTTYTCSTCGHSYVGNYVEALGQTYTVSFSVPAGVTSIADMACGKSGITLPTTGTLDGYKFEGWTNAPVEDTESKPTILTGTYKATENTTLYAVYSYVEGGSGATSYQLVSNVNQLQAGMKLVIASNDKGYVAGAISNQYMSHISASFSSDKTTLNTLPNGAVVLTLGGKTGTWTFANSNGKLLGATAEKKLAWGSGTTTWSISIDSEGGATIQNSTSSYGAFRYNSSAPRFTTYTSKVNASMLLPQLYMEVAAGTTYYTTMTPQEPAVTLTHISLDPSHDALGYKAAATNLPQGAHVEISLWVTEDRVVTKSAETLRLKNILAYNGGQTEIFAKAQIVDAQGNVIAESAVVKTTMRQTLETVDTAWNTYSADQKNAVLALCKQYLSAVSDWNIPNIKNSL